MRLICSNTSQQLIPAGGRQKATGAEIAPPGLPGSGIPRSGSDGEGLGGIEYHDLPKVLLRESPLPQVREKFSKKECITPEITSTFFPR